MTYKSYISVLQYRADSKYNIGQIRPTISGRFDLLYRADSTYNIGQIRPKISGRFDVQESPMIYAIGGFWNFFNFANNLFVRFNGDGKQVTYYDIYCISRPILSAEN